jgi:hypothetical protein
VIPAEATMLPDITNEPDNCIAILLWYSDWYKVSVSV